MSGSALAPWTIAKDSDYHVESLSKSVNCDPSSLASSFELITCLRSKSVEELLKSDIYDNADADMYKPMFGPIVDGLLIPNDPINLMESAINADNNNYVNNNNNNNNNFNNKQTSSASISANIGHVASTKRSSTHSLMAGVTKSEYPFIFTDAEERNGLNNEDKRDNILYNLITSIVDYYQEVRSPSSSPFSASLYCQRL